MTAVRSATDGAVGRAHALLLSSRGKHAPVDADSVVFSATRGSLAMPVMFGVATIIEMVVVHLLVPWLWFGFALAAVSVASLYVLSTSVAVHRVHPHVLSTNTLTLRMSGKTVATVNRANIASARIHRRYGTVSAALDGRRLILPTQDGTVVDIQLTSPAPVLVPAPLARWRIAGEADTISLHVDDPAALIAALR